MRTLYHAAVIDSFDNHTRPTWFVVLWSMNTWFFPLLVIKLSYPRSHTCCILDTANETSARTWKEDYLLFRISGSMTKKQEWWNQDYVIIFLQEKVEWFSLNMSVF